MTRSVSRSDPIYADDLIPGTTYDLGTYEVSREEILEFARRWDPQGFHLYDEVADAGPFDGIIASGIHSLAILQRLLVDGALGSWAVIAGRSLTDLQMASPVRPGMELAGRLRVESVEMKGNGRALVHETCTLLHNETTVLSYFGSAYVRTRPVPGAD